MCPSVLPSIDYANNKDFSDGVKEVDKPGHDLFMDLAHDHKNPSFKGYTHPNEGCSFEIYLLIHIYIRTDGLPSISIKLSGITRHQSVSIQAHMRNGGGMGGGYH